MPALLKEQNAKEEDEELKLRLAKRRVNLICMSSFLSLCQHIMPVQTEPRLVLELCKGNQAAAARLLGNTSGLVGLLSLFINQAGGRISDIIGRKPGFLLGPVSNILLGTLVYKNSSNAAFVVVCRMLRLILTTFSNTVMVDAALADVCSQGGVSLEQAKSQVMFATGAAMLVIPFLEARLLQKGLKHVYLALSGVAVAHAAFGLLALPETLPPALRSKGKLDLAMFNPLGFIRVFTEGTRALWQLTALTTLQMFLEGKNISDIAQTWVREELKWSVTGIRNFVIIYGTLCTASAAYLAPWLRTQLNAKDFTTLTNLLNAFGFCIRGVKASTLLWLVAMVPMLPGVNGTCAIPLKARATELATAQGFGKGEYSAWANNLRALIGSIAPLLYGQIWAAMQKRGKNPGWTFAFAGVVGALVPQFMLWAMKDSDLGVEKKAVART